jgi:hypothetical protein
LPRKRKTAKVMWSRMEHGTTTRSHCAMRRSLVGGGGAKRRRRL